ncbi:unnamed protein product, partial [Mesorhabditis spiculigera]
MLRKFSGRLPFRSWHDRQTVRTFSWAAPRRTTPGLFGNPLLATPQNFVELNERTRAAAFSLIDRIEKGDESRTTVQLFDDLSNEICCAADVVECIRQMHTDPTFNQAAEASAHDFCDLVETINTRRSLYEKLLSAKKTEADRMDAMDARTLELFLDDFHQSGVQLPDDQRKRFVDLSTEIFMAGSRYQQMCDTPAKISKEDQARFRFPQDLIAGPWSTYPDYRIRSFTSQAFYKHNDAQEANLKLLVGKRHELARLTGFESYAHRAQYNSILGEYSVCKDFLEGLIDKLRPAVDEELRVLVDMRERLGYSHEDEGKLAESDIQYLASRCRDPGTTPSVEPNQFTVGCMMDCFEKICNSLYGVSFEYEPLSAGEVWPGMVFKIGVRDSNANLLGTIYLDIENRESKATGDCHYTLRCSKQLSDGDWQTPIVLLSLSISRQSSGDWRSFQLRTHQAENLFHEMGHAMHSMLGRTRYQHVAGTRCPQDMAEIPSNLMENFFNDPTAMSKSLELADHNSTQLLSLFNSIAKSRASFLSLELTQQATTALFDLEVHSALAKNVAEGRLSSTALMSRITEWATPTISRTEGYAWQHRFHHLVQYGARYYSYLVARSSASLIYNELFAKDPLNRKSGDRWALAQSHGGGIHPQELLKGLLNYTPSSTTLTNAVLEEVKKAKSLDSPIISDRVAIVSSTAYLLRQHASPFLVNNIVVHLTALFKEDVQNANTIRFAIVNALEACKPHLSHTFSTDKIVANILVVSHSTDITARSLTLQMLASLAPCAKDHKQVHHLIVESLLSLHDEEFASAAAALREYVPLSTWLNFLLDDLEQASSWHYQLSALRSVKRLAKYGHMWNEDAIQKLCKLQGMLGTKEPLLFTYLEILEVIAERALPAHIKRLNELLEQGLSTYVTSEHLKVRVAYLNLVSLLLGRAPALAARQHGLGKAFATAFAQRMDEKTGKKATFIRYTREAGDPGTQANDALRLVESLGPSHSSAPLFVEMFAQMADSIPDTVVHLAPWARNSFGRAEFLKLATRQLAFIAMSHTDIVRSLPAEWATDDLQRYKVALLAFRTGHWSDVARPLLAGIEQQRLSFISGGWITVLRLLSASQPLEFAIDDLEAAVDSLRQAELLLKRLQHGSYSADFLFTSRFLTCLLSTQMVYAAIYRSLAHFLHGIESLANPTVCDRAARALENSVLVAKEAHENWSALSRSCFAADNRTLDILHLMAAMTGLLQYGLQMMTSSIDPTPIVIPTLDAPTTMSVRQRQLLEWAKNNIEQITRLGVTEEHRVSEQTVNHFVVVLKALCMHRLGLPRYLFHQPCQFGITLSVTPNTPEYHALPNQPVPMKVTGAVTSRGLLAPIEQIVVTAIVRFPTNAAKCDFEQSQVVSFKDDKFFHANFLLHFISNCTVDFFVEFVDAERRQNWRSEATTSVSIRVTE